MESVLLRLDCPLACQVDYVNKLLGCVLAAETINAGFLTFLAGTQITFGSKLGDSQFSVELITCFAVITLLLFVN